MRTSPATKFAKSQFRGPYGCLMSFHLAWLHLESPWLEMISSTNWLATFSDRHVLGTFCDSKVTTSLCRWGLWISRYEWYYTAVRYHLPTRSIALGRKTRLVLLHMLCYVQWRCQWLAWHGFFTLTSILILKGFWFTQDASDLVFVLLAIPVQIPGDVLRSLWTGVQEDYCTARAR